MNLTRLVLDNHNNFLFPVANNSIDFKSSDSNTFLLYFGLPNSPITAVDDDGILIAPTNVKVQSDIEPRKDKISYPTFFTQLSYTFFAFKDCSFEQIPSKPFLDTCEEYLSIINKFNSPVFTPLKADIDGNIQKLRRKFNENIMKYSTLYAMINEEIEKHTTNERNSVTDALLWLKRSFEFLSSLLHEFGIGDKTLLNAARNAYNQTLKQHHGLLAQNVFSFALRAIPTTSDFLRSLAINSDDAAEKDFEQQIFQEMLEQSSIASFVLNKITSFYSTHRLD